MTDVFLRQDQFERSVILARSCKATEYEMRWDSEYLSYIVPQRTEDMNDEEFLDIYEKCLDEAISKHNRGRLVYDDYDCRYW